MSLAGVSGTIGTVVGLGVTLGALGLAFEFADRAVDRTTRAVEPRRRKVKRKPLFDTNLKSGRKQRQQSFDTGRQNINSVFDPAPRRNGGSRKRKQNVFGGDFF